MLEPPQTSAKAPIVSVMDTVTEGYGDEGDHSWKVMDGYSNLMSTLRWMVMSGQNSWCSSNSQSQNLIAHPKPTSMDDHG